MTTPLDGEPSASFKDQSVVVTGAGSGIGLGVARAFARAGANVALSDVDGALAERAAADVNATLGRAAVWGAPCDVGDPIALARWMDEATLRLGGVDVAVANAGITVMATVLDARPGEFDRIVNVNLRGCFFTAQHAARTMVDRKKAGRLVLLSSVLGRVATRGSAVYSATKAGIEALARGFALELGPHGITANAVAPGATLTERTQVETGDYDTEWSSVAATGRVATADDIAAAVLFLASPGARQLTGQTIVVDGAWTTAGRTPATYR